MTGSAAAAVAEIAGNRHLITLDKGHRLEIRKAGAQALVIESRPVTEFSAAVDNKGVVHIAAWLLSRQMMYYTSSDGDVFSRSTLLKSDAGLRLKDCLISSGESVEVAYVAETEHADTLVCYRYSMGDWEGSRVVEVEHPGRLTALQFDGAPGGLCVIYGAREQGRTTVVSRPLSGDAAPEVVATVTGSLTDFCALTSGGARQSCWIADGHLMINGLRQSEEPWSCSWPCLRCEVSGIHCLWIENESVCGVVLGGQRARLRPAQSRDLLPCMLALPGELRRAVVDARTLQEISLASELQERARAAQAAAPQGSRPEGHRSAPPSDLTLTDVVRNQAVYITRMQESLSAMERNMLRMQAEVNRLTKEMSSVVRAKEVLPRPERPYNVVSAEVKAAQQDAAQPEPQEKPEKQEDDPAEPDEPGDNEDNDYTGA